MDSLELAGEEEEQNDDNEKKSAHVAPDPSKFKEDYKIKLTVPRSE